MFMKLRHVLRRPDDDGAAGGAAAPAASPPASAPASAPAAAAPAAPAPPASAPAAGAPAAPASSPAPAEGKGADGYWPPDWRETVSKEDAKTLTRLQRYASPEAAMSALIAAQNRIASGELAPVLGKNPTPEQLAEYRSARGIPETPDKYDLGKDVKIDDAEKPLLSKLFEAAHGTNQTPEQVKATFNTWREVQRLAAEDRHQKDEDTKVAAEDALRVEWGPEFRKNLNLINGMLDGTASQALKDTLLDARLPDGTKFGNSPDVMRLLVSLALVQNPTGIVVPGGSGDIGKGIREELDKINKVRSESRSTYDKDEKMQARERELIASAIKTGLMTESGTWK
jgi:hypothetical protein